MHSIFPPGLNRGSLGTRQFDLQLLIFHKSATMKSSINAKVFTSREKKVYKNEIKCRI